jgi:hypothetical protein
MMSELFVLLIAVSQLLLVVRMERQRRALRSLGEAMSETHRVLTYLMEREGTRR